MECGREIMATSSSSSTRANRQNKHPSLKGHFLGLNFHERKSLKIFLYVYWHSRATNKRFRNFVSGNEEGKIKHVFAHRTKGAAGYPCNVFLKKQNKNCNYFPALDCRWLLKCALMESILCMRQRLDVIN